MEGAKAINEPAPKSIEQWRKKDHIKFEAKAGEASSFAALARALEEYAGEEAQILGVDYYGQEVFIDVRPILEGLREEKPSFVTPEQTRCAGYDTALFGAIKRLGGM